MSDAGTRIPSVAVWGIIGLTLAVAAGLRLQGIDRSLGHDEVFTWVMFASKPWSVIFSSYEVPNNHIFHTLCVKLSVTLFGQSDWAIRLPAAMAGIAVVAASFLLAQALTGSIGTSLVAALLMALCPGQVAASIQARGYTLLVLMSTLHAYCAWRAAEVPRPLHAMRWWGGFGATGFLAVLTVPSGLYLVSAVLVWAGGSLLYAARLAGGHPVTRSLARICPFLVGAVLMLVLVAVVYLPLQEQLELQSRHWGISLSETPGTLVDIWLGVLAQAGPSRWPLVGFAFALCGLIGLALERRRTVALILLIMTLPFGLNLLMGVAGPSRVYGFSTPFIMLLVARGVMAVPRLIQRARHDWGSGIRRSTSLGIGVGVAVASFLPTSFDGPSDNGYRVFGEMITEEVSEGDLVVVPYIMDSSLGYYTDGLLEERVREVVLKGRLQRLLVAARSGAGPRYSLADYMLTTNFTTAEAGHTDRYRNYELPAGAFQAVRQTGNLRLFESLHPPEIVVDGSEHLATDAWRVYYESHPNTTKISTGVDDGSRELRLSAVNEAIFVLHSTFRFDPGGDGLLLLAYTKSGAEGAYVSLYQAGSATGAEDLWAVQMAKPLSQTIKLDDAGEERPFAELYLIQVKAQRHYGLYIYSRGLVEQSFGDFNLYFVPFSTRPAG